MASKEEDIHVELEPLTPKSPLSPPKTSKSKDATLSRFQIILMLFYVVIVLVAALVITLVPTIKHHIYDLMIEINTEMSLKFGFLLFILGFFLVLLGFPISLYEMALGFIIDDYFIALLLDIIFKTLGCLCIFLISRWCLKPRIEILFNDSLIFKAIQRGVHKNPWKALILLKALAVPHIFKNYPLGVTDVSVWKFLIVSIFTAGIFGSIWIYFGSEMKSLNEVFNAKTRPQSYYWIKYSLVGLTVLLLIILCWGARLYFNEMKTEISKEESLKKESENKENIEQDRKENGYGTI